MSEIRANSITNVAGNGAPNFPNGLSGSVSQRFVATGAISAGNAVGLNPDGTVSVVTSFYGSPTTYESASTSRPRAAFDTVNNRLVVLYQDNGNSSFLTAAVGSISGTTITFGTPVVVASVNTIGSHDITFDPVNGRVFVIYNNYGNGGTFGIVGTVSGTSISFGSPSSTIDGTSGYIYGTGVACCYHPSSGRIVVSYGQQSSGPYFRVGTISGTSVSFGLQVQASNNNAIGSGLGPNFSQSLTVDTANDRVVYGAVLQLTGVSPSQYMFQSFVGTVSGTSISVGSAVIPASLGTTVANSAAVSYNSSSGRVLFAAAAANSLSVYLGTVSGTSISYAAPVAVPGIVANNVSLTPYPRGGLTAFSYSTSTVTYVSLVSAGGTTPSLSSPVVIAIAGAAAATNQSANAIALAGARPSDFFGQAVAFNTNSTYPTWIGIAAENISNGASGAVTVPGGINTSVSGLTGGTTYTIDPTTGSLSATFSTGSIGIATSTTSIYLSSGKVL
jgi:hypothetical protein